MPPKKKLVKNNEAKVVNIKGVIYDSNSTSMKDGKEGYCHISDKLMVEQEEFQIYKLTACPQVEINGSHILLLNPKTIEKTREKLVNIILPKPFDTSLHFNKIFFCCGSLVDNKKVEKWKLHPINKEKWNECLSYWGKCNTKKTSLEEESLSKLKEMGLLYEKKAIIKKKLVVATKKNKKKRKIDYSSSNDDDGTDYSSSFYCESEELQEEEEEEDENQHLEFEQEEGDYEMDDEVIAEIDGEEELEQVEEDVDMTNL